MLFQVPFRSNKLFYYYCCCNFLKNLKRNRMEMEWFNWLQNLLFIVRCCSHSRIIFYFLFYHAMPQASWSMHHSRCWCVQFALSNNNNNDNGTKKETNSRQLCCHRATNEYTNEFTICAVKVLDLCESWQ